MEGTPFGPYQLIELLGRGGMGEVWRAYDTATFNRTVAIKLLPPHLAGDPLFVQRFRREAEAAARLNNPHIVPIHASGEIDGRLYVDMRLIEGRDLQAVLADGPLEPARAVPIIEQVAKALHAAHKVGLVHRDVKPSNILVDEDDFAYLIDFGIARGAAETRMTGTGSVIGSWPYMSPERLQAGQIDARSDIYALACVLYECLTGSTPYPGDNLEQQITAHLTAPPPRPSSTDPNIAVAFDTVVATGMAKQPDQRYATTVELAHAERDAITTPMPAAGPTMQVPPGESTALASQWSAPGGVSPSAATQLGPNQQAQPSAPKSPGRRLRGTTHPPGRDILPSPRRGVTPVVLAILAAVVIIGAAVLFLATRQTQSNQTPSSPTALVTDPHSGTSIPEASESTAPTTTTPASSALEATPQRPNGDLGLSTPMSRPACDGTGIVVLGNATNPGSYAADIQRFLDQYPGASYLRTDEACPSLRQSLNGNPIYSVYRVAGRTEADICAAVRAAGGDAYGKWLDTSTDPNSYIRQSCFH